MAISQGLGNRSGTAFVPLSPSSIGSPPGTTGASIHWRQRSVHINSVGLCRVAGLYGGMNWAVLELFLFIMYCTARC